MDSMPWSFHTRNHPITLNNLTNKVESWNRKGRRMQQHAQLNHQPLLFGEVAVGQNVRDSQSQSSSQREQKSRQERVARPERDGRRMQHGTWQHPERLGHPSQTMQQTSRQEQGSRRQRQCPRCAFQYIEEKITSPSGSDFADSECESDSQLTGQADPHKERYASSFERPRPRYSRGDQRHRTLPRNMPRDQVLWELYGHPKRRRIGESPWKLWSRDRLHDPVKEVGHDQVSRRKDGQRCRKMKW